MSNEKVTTLFYYSHYDGILRETAVIKETDRTYIVEETKGYATRIGKPNSDYPYMRNGNADFFTSREAAVEKLKDLCRFKVQELTGWQEILKELEKEG